MTIDTTNLEVALQADLDAVTGATSDTDMLVLAKAAEGLFLDRTIFDAELQTRVTAVTGTETGKELLKVSKTLEAPVDRVDCPTTVPGYFKQTSVSRQTQLMIDHPVPGSFLINPRTSSDALVIYEPDGTQVLAFGNVNAFETGHIHWAFPPVYDQPNNRVIIGSWVSGAIMIRKYNATTGAQEGGDITTTGSFTLDGNEWRRGHVELSGDNMTFIGNTDLYTVDLSAETVVFSAAGASLLADGSSVLLSGYRTSDNNLILNVLTDSVTSDYCSYTLQRKDGVVNNVRVQRRRSLPSVGYVQTQGNYVNLWDANMGTQTARYIRFIRSEFDEYLHRLADYLGLPA